MSRSLLLVVSVALSAGGCLTLDDAPTPGPEGSSTAAPILTAPPRRAGELVVGVAADPLSFVPVAEDDAGVLVGDLLYDPLYRLDPTLTPQPALATALPTISTDGLAWGIELRSGATFHDGSPVRASDVAFTLGLARSPSCPFGRELCDAVSSRLDRAEGDGQSLAITLRAPWSPFLAVVLARLPVLSETAVRAGARSMTGDASALDPIALQELVAGITEETNADRCLVAQPPSGCRLADHADDLLGVLDEGGVSPPPAERFAAPDGTVDDEAHGEALLRAVAALATVLQSEGDDRLAAAVPLLDVARHPLGGGPFLLEAYRPGDSVELRRHDGHMPVAAGSERLRLRIIRDPSTAVTALRGGQVDWLLDVQPDQAVGLEGEASLVVAAHPEPSVRSIVFNVRPGRVFRDAVARRAVVLCLDRTALVAQATGGTALPSAVEMAPASWATAGAAQPAPDPERASAELEEAGWSRGADGIYQRGGVRLSTEIHVRPTRLDLLTFARGATEQLRACGIELVVQELEQTGDLLLAQLQWPNDFETVLVARPLGVDPDLDAAAFEGSHVTSRDNPGDANPGGYSSATVDRLLAEARATADQGARADLYAEVAEELATDPPSLPLWYDPALAALSSRVERAADGGSVDPGQPRYWWDAWTWGLAPP